MTQAGQSEWTWGLQLTELGRLAPFALCSVDTRCESWNYSSIWLLQEKLGWVQDQYMEVAEVRGQRESVSAWMLFEIYSQWGNKLHFKDWFKLGFQKHPDIIWFIKKFIYLILSYRHLLHENICICVHHLYLSMNMV